MLNTLYTFILYIIQPLVICRLLFRSRKIPAYKHRLAERYGIFTMPTPKKPSIWVHCVSVGETIAAAPIVKGLIACYPDYRIIVTTMTPTGSAQVKRLYDETVFHVYAPYDLPSAIQRFLKKTKPLLTIIMETELWPNTIRLCSEHGIPVMVANARLSARSAKGYARLNKTGFVRKMLTNIHTLAAQHQDDANRFLSLGLPKHALHITGSIKYDVHAPEGIEQKGALLRSTWLHHKPNSTKIAIFASTHKGEEEQLLPILSTIQASVANILFVIVPRHPDRFDQVAQLCMKAGFNVARRSMQQTVQKETDIVLADTMGEMFLLLSASDIVYMGGSLMPIGGHNFLEPAMLGLPQISGPHVFNFQHIADELSSEGALIINKSAAEIAQSFTYLLTQQEACHNMGLAAKKAVNKQRGALATHFALIKKIVEEV